MKMKKVLMIIPQNTSGGAERVMSLLACNFTRWGIDVVLVNFDTESNFYHISDKVDWRKMKLEFKSTSKTGKIFEAPIKEGKRFLYINHIIKEIKPDVVIPFLEMAEVLTIPNCLLTHTPFVLSVRNDYNAYFNYMKVLSKITYHKAKMVVCQTEAARKDLLKSITCKTTVIPNPLDDSSYSYEEDVSIRRKVIINVGRLMPQKNQKMLIKAFASISAVIPEYQLYIYGKGDLEEELVSLIRELKLSDRVFLKGVIPNVLRENRDVALFVMSSDYEGFPNTLVEAMANGIPVISTDFSTGAARELLNNGEYGGVVSVGDEEGLSKEILSVLNNPFVAEKKARKGLYVREKFRTENICKQWISTIENALSEG